MGLLESFACLKGKVVNFKSDTNVRQLLSEIEDERFHLLHGKWEEVDQVQYPSKVCKLQFSKSKSNTITNPIGILISRKRRSGIQFLFC